MNLEKHLGLNQTKIIKIFLHLSQDEQRKRFLERIDDPRKHWKFNVADIEERKFWPAYMNAYEACLKATSTPEAPWYVVPADDKQTSRLIVSKIIVETLKGLKMSYPQSDAEHRRQLQGIRARLLQ